MSRKPLHALTWSQDLTLYELSTSGQLQQQFPPKDETTWLVWLSKERSFTFQGIAGSLYVYKEDRPRGGGYWYAYHTTSDRTSKRYLGRTTNVTFARLEEVAETLNDESAPPLVPASSEIAEHSAQPVPSREVWSGMVLLSARLAHPLLPSSLVVRERLLTRLDGALSHRLTLLSASAGWGKTTLLSAWAARSSFPLSWLSLDELDNEPTRFWVSVLAALRTCLPGVGETADSMLRSPQPVPLTVILLTLLHELGDLTQPFILLVDDYHLMEDRAIHDSLLFVLERLPAHLHLVLASRVDPPLALARWRARGQLLELRDADLRFHEEEAAHFFTQAMSLTLAPGDVAQLTLRTEGWVAGLQLAALSMQHRDNYSAFVQSFTGSHRHVLDYVQEEILARLPVTLQHFLPQIAILNKISAPLCQAITGEAESWTLLAQAERANLFLVPLDEERRWYRMHDLFREALLTRLRADQSEAMGLLHQRAARCFAEQGEFQEAIPHALAGSDFSYAADLMEQAVEEFWLHGESQRISTWIMALPAPVIQEHAHLVLTASLYQVWSATSTVKALQVKVHREAEQMMARVEAALLLHKEQMLSTSSAEAALLHRRLQLLRLFISVQNVTQQGNAELYGKSLQEARELGMGEEVLWRMIPLSMHFIFNFSLKQGGALLVAELLAAKQEISRSGNTFAILRVMQWLALVEVRAGHLHQAHQEALTALDLLERLAGYGLLTGYFYMVLANVFLEWNQLDEARRVAYKLIRVAEVWQQVDLHLVGYSYLLEIELAENDLAATSQAHQAFERLMIEQGSPYYQSWSMALTIQYWLAQGKQEEASAWAAQTTLHPDDWQPGRFWELLALTQVYLAQQQYARAIELLERFCTRLDQPDNIEIAVTFLAHYIAALAGSEKKEQAHAVLARLLSLTETHGHIRVYLNQGELMKQALKTFLEKPQNGLSALSRASILKLLEAFEQEEQRRAWRTDVWPAVSHKQESFRLITADDSSTVAFLEPLTSQEQRVLRLLVAGRSNQEIARLLVISHNTVKTHVKNLYSKLHVNSRDQASALARKLRLL